MLIGDGISDNEMKRKSMNSRLGIVAEKPHIVLIIEQIEGVMKGHKIHGPFETRSKKESTSKIEIQPQICTSRIMIGLLLASAPIKRYKARSNRCGNIFS